MGIAVYYRLLFDAPNFPVLQVQSPNPIHFDLQERSPIKPLAVPPWTTTLPVFKQRTVRFLNYIWNVLRGTC